MVLLLNKQLIINRTNRSIKYIKNYIPLKDSKIIFNYKFYIY